MWKIFFKTTMEIKERNPSKSGILCWVSDWTHWKLLTKIPDSRACRSRWGNISRDRKCGKILRECSSWSESKFGMVNETMSVPNVEQTTFVRVLPGENKPTANMRCCQSLHLNGLKDIPANGKHLGLFKNAVPRNLELNNKLNYLKKFGGKISCSYYIQEQGLSMVTVKLR